MGVPTPNVGQVECVLLLLALGGVRGEIIKPYGEWLCNYCAMGETVDIGVSKILCHSKFNKANSKLGKAQVGTTPTWKLWSKIASHAIIMLLICLVGTSASAQKN